MKKPILAAMLIALALPSPTLADPPRDKPAQALNYDYDDELVQGDLPQTNLEILQVRKRTNRNSLITIRSSYRNELLESVENL